MKSTSNKLVAFAWYGGKTGHLNWILPIINRTPHKNYVESFGGSAAILLNKNPSPIETYNDLFGDLVNFFRVLRTNGNELVEQLRLTLYSREEFADACKNKEGDSALERARKFYVRARQVRSGLATVASRGQWAYVMQDSRKGKALKVSQWLTGIEGLPQICERLRNIQIENLDACEVIKRYDTPQTLHYVDPPYVRSTRTGGIGYAHEIDDDKHVELLNLLKTLNGKVLLSGYKSDLYQDILKGWHVLEGHFKKSCATKNAEGGKDVRQEILWANYNTDTHDIIFESDE
jgi:DNA adenine methylase